MPLKEKVGQMAQIRAGKRAIADVLFGAVDPSGRLPVSSADRQNGVVKFTVANAVLPPGQLLAGFYRAELAAGQPKQVEMPFELARLVLTAGDVGGDERREVARGGHEAAFTVR